MVTRQGVTTPKLKTPGVTEVIFFAPLLRYSVGTKGDKFYLKEIKSAKYQRMEETHVLLHTPIIITLVQSLSWMIDDAGH